MKVIDKLKDGIRLRVSKLASDRVIRGFDEFVSGNPARRALLSYLVFPLLLPPILRDRTKFSNRGIAEQIPRALNELGYVVDITNFDNRSWVPSQPYDLFIGHGGINFERLSRCLPDSTPRIYFSTGIYWGEGNARLARRIHELALRRGFLLPLHRSVLFDEEYANQIADGIICLGNEFAVETYSRFRHVIGMNNAIFPIKRYAWRNKDYGEGRRHFLFFSGRGSVLKGLDLLLEAFARTQLHLHICQHLESDFAEVYRHELTGCPNIHVHGFLKMRSRRFSAVAARCNWVISTTCTEGQPGAVLECMGHGLIPILPNTANINMEDWGIVFPDCEVETIRSTVLKASTMQIDECRQRSARVQESTRRTYSVDNFRDNFKKAVIDILTMIDVKGHDDHGSVRVTS